MDENFNCIAADNMDSSHAEPRMCARKPLASDRQYRSKVAV